MTALSTFNETQFHDLAKSPINEIVPCLLYYVTTGRNAWHSTWVQHYSPGCMHTSLISAKGHAERRRTQGTVFTIKEQPSLGLLNAEGFVAITQINTNTPLKDYSEEALVATPSNGAKLIEQSKDNYLVEGANTGAAVLSFDVNSRFWRKPPPKKHSVIVVCADQQDLELEPLAMRKLEAWSSYSNGGNYLLGWRERENEVRGAQVAALG